MAPKKKQTRKGKTIPEHDRRNLELLFQNNFRVAMIFVNIGFMAIVVGVVAFYQVNGSAGIFIFLASSLIFLTMLIFATYLLMRAGRVAKKLGVKETAEKYDV